ncbi:uncharacterized protein LOC110818521 [Carica papaya]|uniref:uncharacterized protein LOC110818521 n=1 Tax=Carica papaya TaxID=3649 RepID=UPI000B8CC273|nr:uncharacterized protein LOC110818521 [Carica papaya]
MATTKPKEAQNPSRTKPLITSHDHNQNQRITKQTGDKDKSSSSTCSSTEKHIPNYLRPTISSRPEPLKQQTGKKNVLEEQKLVRRRSFDRPLSSTPRAQKALISPVPRDRSSVSCRDKMVAGLRSSSFPEEKVVDITNQEEAKKEGPIKLDEGSTDPDHLTSEYSSKEVKIDKVEDINKEAEVHESDERVDDHEEGDEEQNHNEEEGMCRQEIVKSDEGSVEEDVKGGDEIGKQAVGGGQGKKESPIAYNNVIEETASKLLEKRKNKVKALVGAFETVIDYETAASK